MSIANDPFAVIVAIFVTVIIVISVSLFSAYTSFDFTKWRWIAFIALGGLILTSVTGGIVFSFTEEPNWWHLAYAVAGVVIFTLVSC